MRKTVAALAAATLLGGIIAGASSGQAQPGSGLRRRIVTIHSRHHGVAKPGETVTVRNLCTRDWPIRLSGGFRVPEGVEVRGSYPYLARLDSGAYRGGWAVEVVNIANSNRTIDLYLTCGRRGEW
jgi:hypothetical protein